MPNPMRPKDPDDVFPGVWYAVRLYWEPLGEFRDTQRPERDDLAFEGTLNDAVWRTKLEAAATEQRYSLALHPTNQRKTRGYGSDGETALTLEIVPVEAPAS